ncbi:serine hydrolase domain-containing protein [Cryptosporangium arvum]|uniref:serine hydrolase domain-containing protein n=1 Tax=Cryptosporangium arvum TaxID=80871 RepID=UPI0004B3EEFB|nr:serine hydrolase domain-containing protein [Cryptosporangium arvum]
MGPDELATKLTELIDRHGIPGAQLAVLDGDTITEVAAGVLSLRTGARAGTDALFLPGSIGKLYTASLVLMLVDEGLVELDAPVRRYLTDFQVADKDARDTVTIRNLLSHTSGFDGDVFLDTGRGDDALRRYIDRIADLPQICPPGTLWSYSNSGYAILGRVVEVIIGVPFEEALRTRLFEPLGLRHTVAFPEDAILHPVAVGHVPDPDDPSSLTVSTTWGLFRSCGPMGASIVASAGDVLEFVRLHLRGGVAADGTRLLSADAVAGMQARQIDLVDDTVLGDGWGLGWILDRWGEVGVIGHDGNSIGQNAFLRVAPDQRFGFCLQTNVESALGLYRELAAWLFGERLGVGPRPDPGQLRSSAVADPARYVGTYERAGFRVEVAEAEESSLVASFVPTRTGPDVEALPPMVDLPLKPTTREDGFLLKLPIADAALLAAFFNPDQPDGRPTYVHFGGRAHRRTD